MARRRNEVPQSVSGFSDYFDMGASAESILQALGYTYDITYLDLPQYRGTLPWVPNLQEQIVRGLSLVTLDIARILLAALQVESDHQTGEPQAVH